MSTTQPHCCGKHDCKGLRYNGWSLNCRFCKEKIIVECLRNRDELRTKELLYVFGLMSKKQTDSGGFKWEVLENDPNRTAAFSQMFNVDSPFGITCESCVEKIEMLLSTHNDDNTGAGHSMPHQNVLNMQQMSDLIAESVEKKISDKLNENMTHLSDTEPSNRKINMSTYRKTLPVCDENGLYSLYISKADKSVTTEEMINYVMEKTDLNNSVFKIEMLPSRGNRKTYTAFKLTTLSPEVCEKIMSPTNWSTEFRVRAFEKKYRMRKSKKRQNLRSEIRQELKRSNRSVNNHIRNNNNNNNERRGMNNQHKRRRENRSYEFGYNNRNRNRNNHNGRYNYEPRHHEHRVNHAYREQLPQTNMPSPFWYQMPYFYPPPQQQVHSQPTMPLFHPHYTHAQHTPHQTFQPFNVQNHNG
ncbi:myb-like protein I, partial [Hylaeus volcanicus]|uniref:myb-like protein I n=1 Tax=Hylaeus volcanicus TaxID=313075 RepID=UPI0023B79DFB